MGQYNNGEYGNGGETGPGYRVSRFRMMLFTFLVITGALFGMSRLAAATESQALQQDKNPPRIAPTDKPLFGLGDPCDPANITWPGSNFNFAPEGEIDPSLTTFIGYGNFPRGGHNIAGVQDVWKWMAEQGMSLQEIAGASYPNTTLKPADDVTVYVQGFGGMPLSKYVSGLGETPDKACGTQDDIDAWNQKADEAGWAQDDPRRNKFKIDNPATEWDCWPEKAIEMEADAGASYAIAGPNSATNANTPADPGTADQVYKGGNGKAWVLADDGLQILTDKKGNPVKAYYSAKPLSVFGTGQPGSVWTTVTGDPKIGSRAGNDGTCFATIPGFDAAQVFPGLGDTWRTQSVTGKDITEILDWASGNPNGIITPEAASYLTKIVNEGGQIRKVKVVSARSGVATKVVLTTDNGDYPVAADLFQFFWNAYYGADSPQAIRSLVFQTLGAN